MTHHSDAAQRIESVSDFIKEVNRHISQHQDQGLLYLYRGECCRYSSCCRLNIFRKNILSSNPYYEKSLFNTMRQQHLTGNTTYLENAIDAQHGEFPSRLLDVSYNCLTALYFAVTPYYHKNITSYDKQSEDGETDHDGMVYIFYIDEIFSPSAENTNENYNAIINKNLHWFSDHAIFQKNHKFIDHTKLNNRIIAQQGAFILFQGNDDEKLPAYMMSEIRIPCECKSKIRKELSSMFGINTASVYPEIVNAAEDLVLKSQYLITEPFCWENEIRYVLSHLRKEISYCKSHLMTMEKHTALYYQTVQTIEQVINSYRIGLIDFLNDLFVPDTYTTHPELHDTNEQLAVKKRKCIREYNTLIDLAMNEFLTECKTEIADLHIREEETQ